MEKPWENETSRCCDAIPRGFRNIMKTIFSWNGIAFYCCAQPGQIEKRARLLEIASRDARQGETKVHRLEIHLIIPLFNARLHDDRFTVWNFDSRYSHGNWFLVNSTRLACLVDSMRLAIICKMIYIYIYIIILSTEFNCETKALDRVFR